MADRLPRVSLGQVVLIGNPENRRVQFFQEALQHFGQSPATVIAYCRLLQDPSQLGDVLKPGTILRIESPGENFDVEKQILCRGAAEAEEEGAPFLPVEQVGQLFFDRGLIIHPRQWYLGFRSLMREVKQQLAAVDDVFCMNSPADLIEFFDKTECHATCEAAGYPVAESFNPISSFEELMETMQQQNCQRVFLKLAHGSSASGVVAFSHHSNRTEVVTSAELVREKGGDQLYNSLKLRRYTDLDEIQVLIDLLCRERVHVEKWLPKASLKRGTTFDLRVVVINGRARHFVVRESRSPLTNLHLGNRRGDGNQLIQSMGESNWSDTLNLCEQVAGLYPESFQIGVDLLLTPGFRQRFILELNAFGDLLPEVRFEGRDTYQSEVWSLLRNASQYIP
ncbi:hypothetical protein Pan241w_06060 [Gimesia alba]|uniref:ATP-grasp domain-containing protein n=1 Tax=Gimesia alba TaxID=2527973 RepID=A0A517R9I4_9PLAN|nr:STM4014 family protein [Gimesia alba]QDT40549.1 hypothetical protein Pan241w_06060 [Gimesia alba]